MKLLVTYNIPREPFQNLPADWEITFPERKNSVKRNCCAYYPITILCWPYFMLRSTGKSSMPEKAEANQQLWSGL